MKLNQINEQIEKTRQRISELQGKLKGLEAQRTEQENLQIVQAVKAVKLTPAELSAFLSAYANGELKLPGQEDEEGYLPELPEDEDEFFDGSNTWEEETEGYDDEE